MKKIAALLLALTMVISIVACGNKNNETTGNNTTTGSDMTTTSTENTNVSDGNTTTDTTSDITTEAVVTPQYTSALEILEAAWGAYGEDEKFYAGGGDYEHMVENAPGKYHLEGEEVGTAIEGQLGFPAAEVGKIDDAASLMHGMNANTFTCGVYHFTNEADVENGIKAIKDTILAKQWWCGFPDTLLIMTVPGNYVIAAYGINDLGMEGVAGAVETFKTKVLANVEGAAVVVETAIEG